MELEQGLILKDNHEAVAFRAALALWADATTDTASERRLDLLRDKTRDVSSFFAWAGKSPAEITALEIKAWQLHLEKRKPKLAAATIYSMLSRVGSFYTWALAKTSLGQVLNVNPVQTARPKAPKKYQTRSTKAWTDEQVLKLLAYLSEAIAAKPKDATLRRDYCLLLFYLLTGMRRAEIIGFRGVDVEMRGGMLILRGRVKGGDFRERELADPLAREALEAYLRVSGRMEVLKTAQPLWIRHDRKSEVPLPLTSHAFVYNLKGYAREAGIGDIHLHQSRHTFARMVAEHAGSLIEVQDALDHKDLGTTRVYVQSIATKKDKHSRHIAQRLKLPHLS